MRQSTISRRELRSSDVRGSMRDARRQRIRDAWSPAERSARAEAAQQRREDLARLLFGAPALEIWAVGAPGDDDLARLAG
ncbi:MAG TPA: hypothetical protein VFB80_13950 [Pirellulaceae bacterium]|nr:hypothetical protein [Pirellulaceae bacterium]